MTDEQQPRFRVRRVVRQRGERSGAEQPAADERVASRDETDEGWGDAPTRRDVEWYEQQRPPHHG